MSIMPTPPVPGSRPAVFAAVILLFVLPGGTNAAMAGDAAATWNLERAAASFDRGYFAQPRDAAEAIRKTGNLMGIAADAKAAPLENRVVGWVEYDFTVPAPGWYELAVLPSPAEHELFMDGAGVPPYYPGTQAGMVHLEAGKHSLRIQKLGWTAFKPITGWRLAAAADPARCFQLHIPGHPGLFPLLRAGDPLRVEVTAGGVPEQSAPLVIGLQLQGKDDSPAASAQAEFPPAARPQTQTLSLPCPAGEYALRVLINGRVLTPQEWRGPLVLAMDTTTSPAKGTELRKELLGEIDCAVTPPDYFGGGETRVMKKEFGAYRESGELGWLQYMDGVNPGWFAYKFTVPDAQQPYYFEVDFPDDIRRTFCLAVRDGAPGSYPTTAGADTGGEFALSGTLQTQGILHWAQSKELRLVCITPQTGYRAAAARIRLYRLPEGLPRLSVPAAGGRGFGNWYEEGGSLMGVYAAPKTGLSGAATAAMRWAESIAYMGGDTLLFTMAVYQFGMYPSRYNVSFNNEQSVDTVGAVVLAAEKHGLKFFGEFHPDARELQWPVPGWDGQAALEAEWPENMSYSRDGISGGKRRTLLSPLHPRNRAWYLGMIREFAERYKDSPAFKGVSLRVMDFFNHGFNNFGSGDNGYDDCTMALFSSATGKTPPVAGDDPDRFRKRYEWLKKNAWEEWLNWRCAEITALHREIAEAVRGLRADLQVVLNVCQFEDVRGAGIDPAALSAIPGVMLMGGTEYGRRGRSPVENYRLRDGLIEPSRLTRLCPPGLPGAYLFGAGYFEATGVVVPPKQLGFDPQMKTNWISGVVNPAGRNYLERYAIALAESDARFLADGGNAYTLGQLVLREFLTEYRQLPPLPFTPRADARDPAAVWERRDGQGLLFYLVNRESVPMEMTFRFAGSGELSRLATGKPVTLRDNTLEVTLPPFGLLTYKAAPTLKITGVTTRAPAELAATARRVNDWLTREAAAAPTRTDLKPEQQALLRAAADTAAGEYKAGHFWRVRTLCEASALQEVFQKTLAYPPLRYPRPELGWLAAKASRFGRSNWAQTFPQADLNQPDPLAARLSGGGAPGMTRTVAGMENLGPLATWQGESARLALPFQVSVPQRFRLWARLAKGPGCGDLAVASDGHTSALKPYSAAEAETGFVVRTVDLPLTPGQTEIDLRRTGGGQVYLDQIYLEPLATPVGPLAFAAYFPNPDQKNWDMALVPETPAGLATDAVFPGTDGKTDRTVKWVPYPGDVLGWNKSVGLNGAWGSVRCPPGPLGPEVIAYCRGNITVPVAREADLIFSATSQVKVFVNGELVVDSVKEKLSLRAWEIRRIKLRAGDNLLLAKLGNAGWPGPEAYRLIAFEAMITDPGELGSAQEGELK